MDSQEIAETARKALKVLDEDGWCKGHLERWRGDGKRGEHCLAGAWNMALHGESTWSQDSADYQPVIDTIWAQYPEFWLGCYHQGIIAMWNNHDDRTEEDVRAILEKLAAQ